MTCVGEIEPEIPACLPMVGILQLTGSIFVPIKLFLLFAPVKNQSLHLSHYSTFDSPVFVGL
uniref:Uncharacterized protein n=1 Tax=Ciona savignyi TaxID=51511 RepID=H2YL41_CIOSA